MIAHSLTQELEHRGISRREFFGHFARRWRRFSGLPETATPRDRRGGGKRSETDPGLARVPGLRRQHRIPSARQPSDGCRSHSRFDFAQLSRNFDGRRRQSGRGGADADSPRQRRQIYRAGRGLHSVRRRWRLLHDRRQVRPAILPARSAAAPPRPSRSAPARHSAAFRRRDRTRPAPCPSPTRCPASRTSSTCRHVRPMRRTSPRSSSTT